MRQPRRTAGAAVGLGLFALVAACSSSTDSESPSVAVSSISCAQSAQDASSITYTVNVSGNARGPVATVLTPEVGLGTGTTDAGKIVGNIDQSVFTGWSFGTGPDDMTRADGDVASTNVTLVASVSKAKPVSTPPVAYAGFHLTVPSGNPLDAEKTATCQ